MTTKTLEELEADAARAAARHEAAIAAAETARQAADEQRDQRLRRYDQALVEAYDDDVAVEQVRQAERDLEEALTSSVLGGAWVGLKLAQLRLSHRSGHAIAAAGRVGVTISYNSHPANSSSFEELGRAVDRAAARTIGVELVALDADRERAGQG